MDVVWRLLTSAEQSPAFRRRIVVCDRRWEWCNSTFLGDLPGTDLVVIGLSQ